MKSISTTKIITLFEYEMTDQLSDRDIRYLGQLNRKHGVEILRPVVQQGKTCFQARQYVGVLRLGHCTLQILPKIHRSEGQGDVESRANAEQSATQNLLLMLDYAGYLGIRETNLASLKSTSDWLEILIYLFSLNLKRQWLQGAFRTYETIDAVLPVLKGKWRLPDQMRRIEQKHQFAVTYDELTVDNSLNRIFRYVVECLWQRTGNSQSRQMLSDLRYWMNEVALLPVVTPQMAQHISLTRLNQHYEPLLNLACLFLERMGLELSAKDQIAFAFIFDMNQLFEGFLTRFIQQHRQEVLPTALQTCQILPQGQKTTSYLARYEDKGAFKLKPDLVFRDHQTYPLLMDFKYKQLKPNQRKLGIAEADFYQMYAYLNRFGCHRVILMYPQFSMLTDPVRSCFSLEERSGQIWAVTLNLLRDLTKPEAKRELMSELKQILEGRNE
ncbi:MAG: McrC family protein [Prochlorotrichaceae cyanobacterium]